MEKTTTFSKWTRGGLDRSPVNILRLISELEGSSQLLKYMDYSDDENVINEMKQRYYKLYFKLKKERQLSSEVEQLTSNE